VKATLSPSEGAPIVRLGKVGRFIGQAVISY
jgi:hypothetical protein